MNEFTQITTNEVIFLILETHCCFKSLFSPNDLRYRISRFLEPFRMNGYPSKTHSLNFEISTEYNEILESWINKILSDRIISLNFDSPDQKMRYLSAFYIFIQESRRFWGKRFSLMALLYSEPDRNAKMCNVMRPREGNDVETFYNFSYLSLIIGVKFLEKSPRFNGQGIKENFYSIFDISSNKFKETYIILSLFSAICHCLNIFCFTFRRKWFSKCFHQLIVLVKFSNILNFLLIMETHKKLQCFYCKG